MNSDKYKTIKEKAIGEGYYSEKRSKFLAFAHHVDSVDEALELVKEYRKKYYDARHCCYAYRVGFDGTEFRANDDGEPSSTAGKPILGQIDSNGLTNTFICVIRYYGGINLGTGGLIVAYREAAADALANSEIEEKFIEEEVTYSFSYPMMNAVMCIIKDMNPRIINQVFDNTCEVTLSIRKGKADELRTRLNKLSFD
ncbi:IMPACT family protein [Prevotella jejuni]|uniref:IMPACT family protein n=1 Tax=Prevotella jejuni TaxID=1177574 RepID=UPI001BAA3835|nr:YigZ family protein [Prevotella jejuni]QUB79287.1 YigZ family protein [Prevotella jejuni]